MTFIRSGLINKNASQRNHEMTRNGTKQILVLFRVISWFMFFNIDEMRSNYSDQEPTRDEEQGEASEPNAPTGGEENAGLSTILDGGLGTGVQTDADDT
ncbi:MAG: hypothetical protein QOH25_1165 [Acidobacteriota bacterium]|nr:hypothetical protein [Acidobacteriota bacterium]